MEDSVKTYLFLVLYLTLENNVECAGTNSVSVDEDGTLSYVIGEGSIATLPKGGYMVRINSNNYEVPQLMPELDMDTKFHMMYTLLKVKHGTNDELVDSIISEKLKEALDNPVIASELKSAMINHKLSQMLSGSLGNTLSGILGIRNPSSTNNEHDCANCPKLDICPLPMAEEYLSSVGKQSSEKSEKEYLN